MLPEPVSVPLSAVTSVERESDGVVKTEERNLCFTRDEDEKKDDDVSVYCVQAQGSLVCWVAACGRDTATLCSTYYTIYIMYTISMAQGHCNTKFHSFARHCPPQL